MSRFRQPFFRRARGLWYVQLDGRQINLGADRDAAFAEYHRLMAMRSYAEANTVAPALGEPASEPSPLVVVVIDEFLDWCQKNRSAETYRWYKDRLNAFCVTIPFDLRVSGLKPFHVQRWVDLKPDAAAGSKRNRIAAVKRALRWAEDLGHIGRSPIASMRKPCCGRKEQIVLPAEFARILALTRDQEFKDLLTVTWECGARPQESLRVEARHVDLVNARWVFPSGESKGGKKDRVVYLTPEALEITQRLMKKHPQGKLFRNTDGKPWTPDATNCRFATIKKKLGKNYSLYALRHSFATRALQRGVDSLTVAHLLGHSDPSMLAKHYAHLSLSPEFLRGQVKRASA